ncbi:MULTISPECIES: response regulator [unclassified Pseudomonas]|uniref:response regulator n=1 Tax=unclassified Pseudomonas TaxID=196821 RepID=UPI00211587B4|nr:MULTISPECIES: transporter substrate-binding domain-containing protein [unclassified Pseudomonas]
MLPRFPWLYPCLMLFCAQLTAATLPVPQALTGLLAAEHYPVNLAAEDWQWLRQKAELRIGVSPSEAPPFSVSAEGHRYEGISADATALVAQLLGLRVKAVTYASDQDALQALQAGTIDVLSRHASPAPSDTLIFSAPYASDRLAVFRPSAEPRHSPPDLAGLQVAVTDEHVEGLRERFPRAQFKVSADPGQAIAAAAFGQADVYLDDLYSAYYQINRSYYDYVRFERFVDVISADYRYGLRADNTRLQRLLDTAIHAIGNERMGALAKRWVGNSFIPGETPLELTSEQRRWIERHPVARLVINDDLAPGAYFDAKGVFTGGIADLLEVITLSTGLHFQVVSRGGGFPEIIDAVRQGDADLAIMTASPTREEHLRFSRPLLGGPFVLLRRAREQASAMSLADKKVAIPTGHVAIPRFRATFPHARLIEAGGSLDSMNLLYQGRADAAVVSLPAARYYNERLFDGQLAIERALDIGPATVNFAMRRSDAELQSIIDKVLRDVAPDELNAISNRWRSPPGMSGETWVDYQWLIVEIITGAALLLGLSLVWVGYLRRQVRARLVAERQLGDQLQFVQALTDSMPPPLYVRDVKGRMLSCNRSYLQAVGLSAAQVLERNVRQLPAGHFERSGDFQRNYLKAMRDGQTVETVCTFQLQGREVWVNHWIQPFNDSKGVTKGVICGWLDITEHRQLVRQLEEAKDSADAASRAKTSFLATMSHEIRTPMNAVIGILELALKRADSTPIDRASIEIAHGSAKSLLSLIGDILDIARIESGHLSLSPKRANLRELAESVVRVFEGLARQKRLNLSLDVDSSINCDVLIDGLRFKQLLSNLVSNAIKFTEEGRISIRMGGVLVEDAVLRVALVVEDTGVGISPAEQSRLFQPFAQVKRNVQHLEGSGLGLVICRSLCEMMGGQVNLSSEPGRGTRVAVDLRLQVLERMSGAVAPSPEPACQVCCLQVLVVDDHQVNRQVLHQQLQFLGHEVIQAQDGQQALACWSAQAFDVVISDCHMPVMSGVELAREIRRQEQEKGLERTVIIGLTADAQPEEIEQCIQAGMDDCLIKPIGLDELGRRLAALGTSGEPSSMPGPLPLPMRHAESPLLDLGPLEVLVSNQPAKFREILDELVGNNRRDSQALGRLLEEGATGALAELAHRIKGAARVVKAQQVVESCRQLEWLCQSTDISVARLAQAVEDVQSAIDALDQALMYLRKFPSDGSDTA